MDHLLHLLFGHSVAYALAAVSMASILGLAVGTIRIGGVGIGIAGVLFAGLALGHFGVKPDSEILDFVREFGLILFVYTIGIQVGPGFFQSLKKDGLTLNLMAASVVVLGVLVTVAVHLIGGVELPVALGLFSGAVTNTPSLAAGQQVLQELGANQVQQAMPGLGYAVAYPFGIIGILLTMILVRRVLRLSPEAEAQAFEAAQHAGIEALDTLSIRVTNPNLDNTVLRDLPGAIEMGVMVSRVMHDGVQDLARPEQTIYLGDILLAIGPTAKLEKLRQIVGEVAEMDLKKAQSDVRWERMVVTNAQVLGKSIAALNLRQMYGCIISRLNRAGLELMPNRSVKLQFGDILTVIGHPEDIARVSPLIGNKASMLQHAQIIPIFIGILLGVALGSIPVHLPGMPAALKLGLAGGPLIAAILLSRVGHLGELVWFMPPATNLALREIGIVLFLAAVGLKAGGRFVETVISGDGLLWMGLAALITLIPLLIVGFIARLVTKQNYLSLCGLLAGSMTDPPALAFANAIHPSSQAPSLAYSTVYPLVMVLRVMAPQVIALFLWAS